MKYSLIKAALPPIYLVSAGVFLGIMFHTKDQSRRKWWAPFFLVLAVQSLTASKYFTFYPPLMSLWTQGTTLYILAAMSLMFIERIPPPRPLLDQTGLSQKKTDGSLIWKFRTTYRVWGNPRMHRVHELNGEERHKVEEKPESRQQLSIFLFLRAIKIPIYYYVYYRLMPTIFNETLAPITTNDVGITQQGLLHRLSDITSREAVIRGHTGLFWILESFLFLDGANALLAIFFVILGLDEPEDWPRLFGSPLDATSLSRFWSHYWHPLATRSYKNYGSVVANSAFGLKPGSVSFNTIVALVVFILSGITHAVTMWQCGVRDWHLEIYWFLLNFLGCCVERAFRMAMRSFAKQIGCSRGLREIENSWLGRLIGYTWVFLFFFWSVPKWKYPRMYQEAAARERWQAFIARLQAS